jgi:hypothetical protein
MQFQARAFTFTHRGLSLGIEDFQGRALFLRGFRRGTIVNIT